MNDHDSKASDTGNMTELQSFKTGEINDKNSSHQVSYADNMTEDGEVCDKSSNHDDEKPIPRRKSSIWVIVRDKISIAEKGGTPVNWKMIGLIFLSLFCSAFSLTFLFPFLPEMILYFGYKEEDKGYYAGLVASGVFLGRMIGSYFWGWLSDKKGRKPVMIITIFLNGLMSLIFGFTVNLPMAFITRLLTGIVNGTVGTAKTVLYEISDNTNQAIGMSVLSVAWGSGIILGPAVGGLLASPARRYPEVFDPNGIFGQFPYIIPSALVFVVCLIGATLDIFFLPETLGLKNEEIKVVKRKKKKDEQFFLTDEDEENTLGIPPKIAMSVEDLHCESEIAMYQVQTDKDKDLPRHDIDSDEEDKNGESSKLLQDQDVKHLHESDQVSVNLEKANEKTNTETYKEEIKIHLSNGNYNNSKSNINGCASSNNNINQLNNPTAENTSLSSSGGSKKGVSSMIKNMILFKLMRMSDVRQAVFLYSSMSFAVIGFEEIFSVWASTETGFDGLGFPPEKIGAALAASSIPLLFVNFYFFPALVKRFELKKSFLGCTTAMILFMTVLPTIHLTHNNESLLWALLMTLLIPQKILASGIFTATSLFVNNSVGPEYAGSVNGIAMTCTALARALAPTIGGSIFAWTVGYGSVIGPPFDVSLAFFFFGFMLWITVVYGVFMSENLSKQKK